jgi:hypothetical protein
MRRDHLTRQFAARFPEQRDQLLPTAFGNIIRAFEVYPDLMFGVDAIYGWLRLLAVVPKDYRNLFDAAKALADFWVNLCVVSLVVVIEYVVLALYQYGFHVLTWPLTWIPFAGLALAWIASARAKKAVCGWGELIKSGFDLYLPALARTLGFSLTGDPDKDRGLWDQYSLAIIYRRPDLMPARAFSQPKTTQTDADNESKLEGA